MDSQIRRLNTIKVEPNARENSASLVNIVKGFGQQTRVQSIPASRRPGVLVWLLLEYLSVDRKSRSLVAGHDQA